MEYNKMLRKLILVALSSLTLPALASIQTQEWTMNANAINGSGYGNQMDIACTACTTTNQLTITGWSDTGSGDNIQSGKLDYSNGYGTTLVGRNESANSPNHAIDSYGGFYDMVLLSFEKAVNLTQIGIGWAQDARNRWADISLAAYKGDTFSTSEFSGQTWSSLRTANAGWDTIGNYGNVGDYDYQSVATGVSSKYWLVGAYNPVFTGGAETSGLGAGNDAFKLASINANFTKSTRPPTDVPEPSSLAIFALAIVGLLRNKRKHTLNV